MKNISGIDNNIKKTDYDIPSFSIKSAFIIMSSAVISTVIIPLILSLFGIESTMITVILNGIILGGTLSFTRFFVESKRGICKKFWYTYASFGVSFSLITYYWLHLGSYI